MSDDAMIKLAVDIVCAYVSNNSVPQTEIPAFIRNVHASLAGFVNQQSPDEGTPVRKATPAIAIKKSVTPDHIVCLEDGQHFMSLRRHLTAVHKMTADEYRRKWGLPGDYPMVASSYSAKRSEIAKTMSLGRRHGQKNKPKGK